jgi:hypothetical protein
MLSLPFTYFNCCRDFVDAFANHFDYLFGAVITEITHAELTVHLFQLLQGLC